MNEDENGSASDKIGGVFLIGLLVLTIVIAGALVVGARALVQIAQAAQSCVQVSR